MSPRRFPTPWSVDEADDCFVVRDNNGQALVHIHFKHKRDRGKATRLFTREEAKYIAAICEVARAASQVRLLEGKWTPRHGKRNSIRQ
jgi:hypothetical protein